MKKLLIAGTALVSAFALSSPAQAKLDMSAGGFFNGYVVYSDSDEVGGAAADLRKYDLRRDSEFYLSGSNTLDNGLTVGAHYEVDVGSTMTTADEVYAYFSGGWGRLNIGSEDASAFLLQVAAPSADSNVDGMRTFISALTARTAQASTAAVVGSGQIMSAASGWNIAPALDYQHADFRQTDRLTYLTPKFNGFQAGVSYAAEAGMNAVGDNTAGMSVDNDGTGVAKSLWEVGARWDGEFEGVAMSLGGGYSDTGIERRATAAQTTVLTANQYYIDDGVKTWNAGANFKWNEFSLGGNYKRSATERTAQTLDAGDLIANVASGDIDRTTYDVGLGWDNGPYHLGASYLFQKSEYDAIAVAANAENVAATEFEATKYTVGGGYTFGPGMSFRGAVAWGEFDATDLAPAAADDNDFTQVTVGTNIAF